MAFQPTHRAPADGLDAFAEHDVAPGSVARLEPNLPVEVADRWGDWARVTCSNGWQAWVDGRVLVATSAATSTASTTATASGPPPAAAVATRPSFAKPDFKNFEISVAMIGAAAIALSTLFNWVKGQNGAPGADSWDGSVIFLLKNDTTNDGPITIGLLLLAAALFGGYALLQKNEQWRRIAGFVTVGVAVVFAIQYQRLVSDFNKAGGDLSLTDILGLGVYLSLAAGLALALGPTTALTKPKS